MYDGFGDGSIDDLSFFSYEATRPNAEIEATNGNLEFAVHGGSSGVRMLTPEGELPTTDGYFDASSTHPQRSSRGTRLWLWWRRHVRRSLGGHHSRA